MSTYHQDPARQAIEVPARSFSGLPDIDPRALDFNLDLMEMLLTDGISGFAYVDLKFHFIRLNQVLASIYDMNAGDLIGRPVVELVGEAGWEKARSCMTAAAGGATVLGVHACDDRPDRTGVIRQRVSSFYPIRSGGVVVGIAAVVNDVTDRVRGEQAVRESEARYRLLAETIPHLVWIIDADGKCEYVNHQFAEYTGFDNADLGRRTWLSYVDPADRASARALWNGVVEAGVSFEMECRFLGRDGSPRWFLVRGVPMSDEKGSNIRWLGTGTDIHDQKSAEETRLFLDGLAERMRAATTPDDILSEVVGGLGRYLKVSRCRFGENNWDSRTIMIRHEYCAPGYKTVAGTFPRSSLSPVISALLASGQPAAMNDTDTDPRTAPYAEFYRQIEYRAGIVAPIIRNGQFVASLSVGMAHEPRVWREDEIALVKRVAERAWLALENSRLYHEKLQADANQRVFVRDVLSIVTDGRLHICDIASELPTPMPTLSGVIDITADGGVRILRHAVRDLAISLGFDRLRSQDLMTAVSEAAMNTLVHAKEGRGWICADDDRAIQVWIADSGLGISMENLPQATLVRGFSTAATLGHGFKMIISSADRVHLLTNASGTTVVVEQFRFAPEPVW